jgi:glutathione S-transferase
MTVGAEELILHHHDISYYSEKARVLLGVKGLPWYSVIEPLISPKPEYTKLTGGYQRVPTLQIGADLYCDSGVVMAELERRYPGPRPFSGLDFVINSWVNKVFTGATFAVALPGMADHMTPEFVDDRAEIYGPAFDLEAMKAASVPMSAQWRANAAWLEHALATSEGDFLTGAEPTIADAAAYIPFWLIDNREFMAAALSKPTEPADTPPPPAPARDGNGGIDSLLDGFDRLKAWRDRIRAIGHGPRSDATHEEAFEAARSSEPGPPPPHDPSDPLGLEPGTQVTVMADDSTRDPVAGTLVAATPERIVVAREEPSLGVLHVHMPRAGYFVQAS